MPTTYRPYQPDQPLLLPPDLQEWVPPGHLAHHVSDDHHRHEPAGSGVALKLAKQTPPPENLIGVEVVTLGHHRHRDPRLMGLRNDLTLLRLAPPPPTATNRSAARRTRLLLHNQHQLSVHLNRSGHLRSAHFPSAQPAKTPPIRTGGLRRMDTQRMPQVLLSFKG